jgi:hypothetical protein
MKPRKKAIAKSRHHGRKKRAGSRTRKRKDPLSVTIERAVLYVDRNGGRGESCYRVRFTDLDGKGQYLDPPRSAFSRASTVAGYLLSAHAQLPVKRADQIESIRKALAARDTARPTLRVTSRVGWHDAAEAGHCFIYFSKTFGSEEDRFEFDVAGRPNPALGMASGTLEGWREGLREACENSDHLIFAAGIAASGPLYGIVGPSAEPAVYHFQGAIKPDDDSRNYKSSSGKTLSARLAQSLFGRCQPQDLFGLSTTWRALEEACFASNHLALVLDEEGTAGEGDMGKEIDPRTLPFRIIAGKSKRRSQGFGGNCFPNLSWLMPVITTSERELDPGGKSLRKEGEQVRMISIPFPPTWEGGIFSRVESPDHRNRLAAQVEQAIANHYGVAMPAYIESLVTHRHSLSAELPRMIAAFLDSVGATADNWERRLGSKFAMVLAGARLLARHGIAPWTEERALTAVTGLYRASRSMTISIPEATTTFLGRLHAHIQDRRRFLRLEKGEAPTDEQKPELIGLLRTVGGHRDVVVLPYFRFESLVRPTLIADQVLAALAVQGRLVTRADGNLRRQLQITGLGNERQRYVCIKLCGIDQ